MASSAADAPSTALGPLQFAAGGWLRRGREALETRLEAERDQLPLWVPVMFGGGISAWFVLPDSNQWVAALLLLGALALLGIALGRGGRAGRALAIAAVTAALGLGLIWGHATRVMAPVLAHPTVAAFEGRIEAVAPLPARGLVRVRLAPIGDVGMPPHVRVNIAEQDVPAGLATGAVIRLRGWFMPPPEASVPGAYDFARIAWFDRLGATGRAFVPVTLVSAGASPGSALRARLSAHIQGEVAGGPGAIAAALATGDQGAIGAEDAEAMRRAGLAHLLSISGLHVTAVVGATMLIVLKLLALSPMLALRLRLPLIAAGAGAVAAVGYTWLTGAEVPTIRSCVAALLVLLAIVIGREALTLRLVAAGALLVLLAFPQSLVGPSFQLSFAAVTAIIALHEHPRVSAWFAARGDGAARRLGRELLALLLTGLVVEIALAPIALYHFHRSGVYGALANIVAIPLTTFIVMPAEALALGFDAVGLGAPFWWAVDHALRLLLWIAHRVADAPGASAALPAMPDGAFGLMVAGGLWIALWRTKWRRLGAVPLAIGAAWALATPAPDLLITRDGQHLALATPEGLALLRERAGDYTRTTLAENSGVTGAPLAMADLADARCSPDLCIADHQAGGRTWRIAAIRSNNFVDYDALIRTCTDADIVVSPRGLPRACRPRWLRLDRQTLARTGGVAISLANGRIVTVRRPGADQPWRDPPTIAPPRGRHATMDVRSTGSKSIGERGTKAGL
ncbi:ComEC/Rec2 family competence protein [Hephaestia sp. GCM10023244]|uniref:ComEC/Rec2 family competence protein n=1 Tax=unclassified Hephaestia TaxID=2631281 RepID=UPI0020777A9E|nr:ComEC/Rec2 family competence protein [Hephaestia sp. MAHUQ-44]MCM8730367.1 ComEC/Rec2 family competence protein [Hephaestia sp. MAHUQ-44]